MLPSPRAMSVTSVASSLTLSMPPRLPISCFDEFAEIH
jgi:hypothetical protein